MKSRPILFSGPMVRALLAGTKTQTRRVAPIDRLDIKEHDGGFVTWSVGFTKPIGKNRTVGSHSGGLVTVDQARQIIAAQFCPYGQPGDRLWVRETLRAKDGFMVYAADDGRIDCDGLDWPACIEPRKTIVSIHMPRWASRLTLEVVSVRVERLQDISEADAWAEGVAHYSSGMTGTPSAGDADAGRVLYRRLWESINGPGSWDANPWVWVVEFKRANGGEG